MQILPEDLALDFNKDHFNQYFDVKGIITFFLNNLIHEKECLHLCTKQKIINIKIHINAISKAITKQMLTIHNIISNVYLQTFIIAMHKTLKCIYYDLNTLTAGDIAFGFFIIHRIHTLSKIHSYIVHKLNKYIKNKWWV